MNRKITDTIIYIGANDHDIDLFEGQYIVPEGMAYNSYLIVDEKVAILDTADARKGEQWLNNLEAALDNIPRGLSSRWRSRWWRSIWGSSRRRAVSRATRASWVATTTLRRGRCRRLSR